MITKGRWNTYTTKNVCYKILGMQEIVHSDFGDQISCEYKIEISRNLDRNYNLVELCLDVWKNKPPDNNKENLVMYSMVKTSQTSLRQIEDTSGT